jgi:hypothetical protein
MAVRQQIIFVRFHGEKLSTSFFGSTKKGKRIRFRFSYGRFLSTSIVTIKPIAIAMIIAIPTPMM